MGIARPCRADYDGFMITAARLEKFGPAAESLVVSQIPARPPRAGEVTVSMRFAPINPADLNVIEGKYGELPGLPATIGNEGAGCISLLGEGVSGLAVGDVVLPMTFGTWTGEMTIPAASVVPVPNGADIEQASMLTVNPATAWRLLHDFVDLAPGDWIVQNAANSGVGRSVIQIAKALGWRTLNVVRRPELVDELLAAGGDRVVLEDCDLRAEVVSLCDGQRPKLGFNAVGGASALNVANALAHSGTLVTFGAMGRQPLKIPNGLLIFSDLSFRGFWLKRWRERAAANEIRSTYAALGDLLQRGVLHSPVHETFPLTRLHDAVTAAARDQRNGKILLDLA